MFKRVLSIIFICLSIAMMAVIFYFSSENSDTSVKTSEGVVAKIASFLYPDFDDITEAQQQMVIESYHHLVRKAAHFTAYAALGFFLCGAAVNIDKFKAKYRVLAGLLVCLLYAASDEIHQAFVPGRGPSVFDVLLDFCGAVTGTVFLLGIYKLICILAERSAAKPDNTPIKAAKF